MTNRVYKNYDCTSIEQVQNYLNDYGVAVIPNVIKSDELEVIKDNMFDTLTHMTRNTKKPITRKNISSWKEIFAMKPLHGMLIQHFGIGHAQFVWDIRQDPRIVEIFAKLWGCDANDLLTSFDGVSISLPPETTGKGWHEKDWYHSDQRFSNNNLHTIQGLVGCYDVNEGDATLTILEGSNKFHHSFAENFGKSGDNTDWYLLKNHEIEYYENLGCHKTFIKATAGSLVLWDSRTIHAGCGPSKTRAEPNIRLVIYVCQKPKMYAKKEDINKKIVAFEKKQLTNHDPCRVKLFNKLPMWMSAAKNIIEPPLDPVLTPLGRKLAGFNPELEHQ